MFQFEERGLEPLQGRVATGTEMRRPRSISTGSHDWNTVTASRPASGAIHPSGLGNTPQLKYRLECPAWGTVSHENIHRLFIDGVWNSRFTKFRLRRAR